MMYQLTPGLPGRESQVTGRAHGVLPVETVKYMYVT